MGYRGGYATQFLTDQQKQIVQWQQAWAVAQEQVGPEYADWIARHRELCGQTETIWMPTPPSGPASSYAPPVNTDWVTMEMVWR